MSRYPNGVSLTRRRVAWRAGMFASVLWPAKPEVRTSSTKCIIAQRGPQVAPPPPWVPRIQNPHQRSSSTSSQRMFKSADPMASVAL